MTAGLTGDQPRALLDRIRTLLPGGPVREVRMFGVVAVMVENAMVVAAHPDGSLLVRVDPAEDARLLDAPGAARAEMGTGRSMGEGWIRVAATAVQDDAALEHWLEVATRYRLGRRSSERAATSPAARRRRSRPGAAGTAAPAR